MNLYKARLYMIRYLLSESPDFDDVKIPLEEEEQRDLLRELMNIRMPEPVDGDFLKIQDEYLQAERDLRGVVDGESLPAVPGEPHISLWQGDITTLKVDAIVNAANSGMLGCFYPLHNCIDNIIHTRSGVQLRILCNEIMKEQGCEEPAGRAKITPAFNLPSRYILHTVGPIIKGEVSQKDRELLASCYRSCLRLAAENGCRSVAFCCISTGEFKFPNEPAAQIAVAAVREFLKESGGDMKVIFDVFKDKDLYIYRDILGVDG